MAYTISTHVGHSLSREHNKRIQSYVSAQKHIDPNGIHENWHDEKEVDVYERLFGAAQRDYNAHQSRKDRKIDDYYQTVKKSQNKQYTAYEMIISIGNKDNAPDPTVGKTVMRAFVDGWAERNPKMEMIGAYYHADEEGVPHVHIDFIPYADHSFKRGMKIQTSYNKALAEMGYTGRLAGANWWANENQTLENICNAQGLDIEHPKEGLSHLDTELYKLAEEYVKQAKESISAMSEMNEIEQTEEKTKFGRTIPAKTTMLTTNFEKMIDINTLLNQADAIAECLQTNASITTLVQNERIAKNAAESAKYDIERENIKLGAENYKLKKENKEIREELNQVKSIVEKAEEWEKCAKTLEYDLEQYKKENKSLQKELNSLEKQQIHKPPTHRR